MGSLGWPEILIILVIALIIFGPRKLPELGKTLGQSLAQFRRASEDFKRTWEEEVEIEKRKLDAPPPSAVEYSSTTDPYEGQDFSLDGSHTGGAANTTPLAEGTDPLVESSEHAVEAAGDEGAVGHIPGEEASAAGDPTQVPVNANDPAAVLATIPSGKPKHDHL